MKKISDDIALALDKCAEALSIHELSRVTGVRIELLRRFISRKTRHVRGENSTRDMVAASKRQCRAANTPTESPPTRIISPGAAAYMQPVCMPFLCASSMPPWATYTGRSPSENTSAS